MQTQTPQTKYGNSVLEPYRPVLVDYLTSQKPRIVGSTAAAESPLEQTVFTMILTDFSSESSPGGTIIPLNVHNTAQINAMVEERHRCEMNGEPYSDERWIKKHSDEYRHEENLLIASLFVREKDYFLDILKRAA